MSSQTRPILPNIIRLFSVFILLATASSAEDTDLKSGDDIIAQYVEKLEVQSEMAYVHMTISRPGQREEELRFFAAYRDDESGSDYMIRLMQPSEVAGVTVLSKLDELGEGQQYLYLPAIGKARPLSTRSKGEPFLGSDFTIDDLLRETPGSQTYTRRDDQTTQGEDCYVVRAFERKPENRIYAFRDLYVSKSTYDLIRIDYYDLDSFEVKNLMAVGYRSNEFDGDSTRPHLAIMTDIQTQSTTTFTLIESRVNAPMPAEVFTTETIASWSDEEVQDFIFGFGFQLDGKP